MTYGPTYIFRHFKFKGGLMAPTYLKRPTEADDVVLDVAAARIASMVPSDCYPMDVSAEDVHDQMFDAMLRPTVFEKALFLKSCHWKITDDVLKVLMQSAAVVSAAMTHAVADWVTENGIRFPAKENETVKFSDPTTGFEKNGVVKAVLRSAAKAIVTVAVFNNGEKTFVDVWVPAEKVRGVVNGKGSMVPVKAVRSTVGASNGATEGEVTNLLPFYPLEPPLRALQ
jgi:hypothetical protein